MQMPISEFLQKVEVQDIDLIEIAQLEREALAIIEQHASGNEEYEYDPGLELRERIRLEIHDCIADVEVHGPIANLKELKGFEELPVVRDILEQLKDPDDRAMIVESIQKAFVMDAIFNLLDDTTHPDELKEEVDLSDRVDALAEKLIQRAA